MCESYTGHWKKAGGCWEGVKKEERKKKEDQKKTPKDFGELQKDVEFLNKLSAMESFDRNKPRVNKCQDIKDIAGQTLQHLKHEND